jgi:hypothetical protein
VNQSKLNRGTVDYFNGYSIDFDRLGVATRDTVDLLIEMHSQYSIEGFSKMVGDGAGTVYYLGDFNSLTDYLVDLLETATVYGLRGIAFHRLLDSGDLETHLFDYGGITYDLVNIDTLTTEEVASW